MKRFALLFLILSSLSLSQTKIPEYYEYDELLSAELEKIVVELGLNKDFDVGEDGTEQISLTVIDMNGPISKIGGVNMDNFIYPASVYKMYVAAEVLHQISSGKYGLYDNYVVLAPNAVDKSREIKWDPRPLLREGDTVTINYLLDLMITRSDNSAANCLIDIARRENINEMIEKYGWEGSEVTRKFLSRKFEDPGYEKIKSTETCALHAADFIYLAATNNLFNPWVSMQLMSFLSRQLDKSKLAAGLPQKCIYSHKTGWFSYWTNDVGFVTDGNIKYIVSCFVPIRERELQGKMKDISSKIYSLMQLRNKR